MYGMIDGNGVLLAVKCNVDAGDTGWIKIPSGAVPYQVTTDGGKTFSDPVPSNKDLAHAARLARDNAIDAVYWRIQRYESQQAASIATTETAATYQALLTYVEALRNWPNTTGSGFPDVTTMPVAP